jgi:TOBE domain
MYLGHSEEYCLRLVNGAALRAIEHNQTTRKAEVGDRVMIQFDPRDVVVLPQEDSSD